MQVNTEYANYGHLAVKSSKRFKMTTQQRKRKVDKLMKACVEEQSTCRSNSVCPLNSLALPPQMTSFLWERANNVAKDETAMLQAPGDDSAWVIECLVSLCDSYLCPRGFPR